MENIIEFDTIVYHTCCPDGVCGLWCAYKYKGNSEFEKIKMCAGKDPVFETYDKNIIFIDVCPSINFIKDNAELAKSIIIIDHHKSGLDMITKNKELLKEYTNVTFIFDMKRSGCQLAWDYFFPDIERSWIVDYVGDRDLWNWKLENAREICSAIDYLCVLDENDLTKIDKLDKYTIIDIENLISTGKIINTYQNNIVQKEVKHSIQGIIYVGNIKYNINIGNISVLSLVSDLGNALTKKLLFNGNVPDFSVIWNYNLLYDTWSISLRGHENSPDLSEIAGFYGGGGHAKAAGFKIVGFNNIKNIIILN